MLAKAPEAPYIVAAFVIFVCIYMQWAKVSFDLIKDDSFSAKQQLYALIISCNRQSAYLRSDHTCHTRYPCFYHKRYPFAHGLIIVI